VDIEGARVDDEVVLLRRGRVMLGGGISDDDDVAVVIEGRTGEALGVVGSSFSVSEGGSGSDIEGVEEGAMGGGWEGRIRKSEISRKVLKSRK
jgi:hypothetical protein